MTTIDESKVEEFLHQAVDELGAAMNSVLVYTGDQLGLFQALADNEPVTPADLASRTGTAERYIREWLNAMAASGWIEYDADGQTYRLPPEQAQVLIGGDFPGAWNLVATVWNDQPALAEAYRTGEGIGWHQHDTRLFAGTARFFRPGYTANLIEAWLPALDGVVDQLEAGATVADVGCGHGVTTILMGQAYPNSTFVGFDYHDASIRAARKEAADAGVADRVSFEVASAKEFPGSYDLVTMFDCLHDMGDPVGASRHVREALKPGGTLMLVEPFAGDAVEENVHPLGRLFYAASAQICTPASLSQEVGLALGAQAGPARLTEVLNEAGFTDVKVAVSGPLNLVIQARA